MHIYWLCFLHILSVFHQSLFANMFGVKDHNAQKVIITVAITNLPLLLARRIKHEYKREIGFVDYVLLDSRDSVQFC